ncbi:MAG: BrnT family toxin [Candidatus Krumholzibacteriia bacterium]
MRYEWDGWKAQINLEKHGVEFADATGVFQDIHAIMVSDESQGEDRYTTIGSDAYGRILVIVHAWRRQHIRIISARVANRRERRQFEG